MVLNASADGRQFSSALGDGEPGEAHGSLGVDPPHLFA